MDEKNILLAEIKREQKEQIEKKFLEQKGQVREEKTYKVEKETKKAEKQSYPERPASKQKTINPFSSKTFADLKVEEPAIKQEENLQEKQQETINASSNYSSIIEKPNYDFIETLTPEQREKIFKEDAEEVEAEPKPKAKRFKLILVSILFAIFGVWGITNIATLDSLSSELAGITTEYNMNLISYLNNLHNLDATNSQNMENLFETIPHDQLPPNLIIEKTNWFDRFCNFIAGLFGG